MAYSYSPERRTALILAGTGTHGAYQAGVLRALQEAGVRIDVVAGQGVGAAGAALACIDGAARLWEADGVWRGGKAVGLYGWRWPLRVAGWLVIPLALALLAGGLMAALGAAVPAALTLGSALFGGAILAVLAGALLTAHLRAPVTRRAAGAWWWRLAGAPLDAQRARELFIDTVWHLLRGAAPLTRPDTRAIGRRYSELLAESLSQPGFRELMILTHDLDTRRDIIAAFLGEPYRREFMARRPGRERQAEAIDLAGVGRDHAIDVIAGALTPPLATDPHLVTFGADSFWRGETHRFVDRPGALARLLQELSEAGVSQVIVISAVPAAAGPHRLTSAGLDLRHRLGEFVSAAEAAAQRDAIEGARLRFDALFLICPSHNPVGPFDFAGAYDEASDRHQTIAELMERAYEDAYRQFIEPVVGASGDHLHIGDAHGQGVLDDADSRR